MPVLTEQHLKNIGFNDPNVISGILGDPGQVSRYEQELGLTAGGGAAPSAAGPDISGVPSVLEYVEKGIGEEDVALKDLVMAMRGREKPADIYAGLEAEAGLPELRKTSTTLSKEIASIEDILEAIEPDVSARTRESLVTEAQRRGMVTAKKTPFFEKLTKLGTALGRVRGSISEAEKGIATKTELTLRGQEMDLEPHELKFSVLVDRNTRKTTGFTADRETQLDQLYAKWNRTNTLSDAEWGLANDIAGEERTYRRTLETTAAEYGIELKGGESDAEILALIGKESARQTAVAEAKGAGGGTATERQQATAKVSLRRDIQGYENFENLIRRYGDILPAHTIREEYNSFHTGTGGEPWGPAGVSEEDVQDWLEGY